MKKNEILIYKNLWDSFKESFNRDYAILMLIVLKALVKENFREIFISYDTIEYFLTKKTSCTKYMKPNYQKGIKALNRKFVVILEETKNGFALDCSKMIGFFREYYYLKIDLEKLRNLYSTYNVNIVYYLVYLLDRLKNKIWINDSLMKLEDNIQMDKRTIMKYNDILEKLHIIYVHRFDKIYMNTGFRVNNLIGLYENKNEIIQNAKKFLKEKKGELKSVNKNAKISESYGTYDTMEQEFADTLSFESLETLENVDNEPEHNEYHHQITDSENHVKELPFDI